MKFLRQKILSWLLFSFFFFCLTAPSVQLNANNKLLVVRVASESSFAVDVKREIVEAFFQATRSTNVIG